MRFVLLGIVVRGLWGVDKATAETRPTVNGGRPTDTVVGPSEEPRIELLTERAVSCGCSIFGSPKILFHLKILPQIAKLM